jgi:hypothetical protein
VPVVVNATSSNPVLVLTVTGHPQCIDFCRGSAIRTVAVHGPGSHRSVSVQRMNMPASVSTSMPRPILWHVAPSGFSRDSISCPAKDSVWR